MSYSAESKNKLLVQIPASILLALMLTLAPEIGATNYVTQDTKPIHPSDNEKILIDLSNLILTAGKDKLSLRECIKTVFGLSENEALSDDYLAAISHIKIRKADNSERGFTDYEFESGFEAIRLFNQALEQGDAIIIEINRQQINFLQQISLIPNLEINSF